MNPIPFRIEKAVPKDYSSICCLIAEEHAMHVLARPDVFQPCDELLTVEEYEAMQKNDSFFLFTAKTIGDETAGLCLQTDRNGFPPRSAKKENSVYRRFYCIGIFSSSGE